MHYQEPVAAIVAFGVAESGGGLRCHDAVGH
jgi:hypothetical protein